MTLLSQQKKWITTHWISIYSDPLLPFNLGYLISLKHWIPLLSNQQKYFRDKRNPSVTVGVLSWVRFFVTPWATACQAPLSRGFPRQEYWPVAIPSFRGSSQPRDWAWVSCITSLQAKSWLMRPRGSPHQWLRMEFKGLPSVIQHIYFFLIYNFKHPILMFHFSNTQGVSKKKKKTAVDLVFSGLTASTDPTGPAPTFLKQGTACLAPAPKASYLADQRWPWAAQTAGIACPAPDAGTAQGAPGGRSSGRWCWASARVPAPTHWPSGPAHGWGRSPGSPGSGRGWRTSPDGCPGKADGRPRGSHPINPHRWIHKHNQIATSRKNRLSSVSEQKV